MHSAWLEVLSIIFLCVSDFQLEPQSIELLAQEERFMEVLKEYELKCRVCALPSYWIRLLLLSLVHGFLIYSCPALPGLPCDKGSSF